MTVTEHTQDHAPLRSARLRAISQALHDSLENTVARYAPVDTPESYGRFLQMQYLFQSELQHLYNDPALIALFPDLPGRCRAEAAKADLIDLGVELPAPVPGAVKNPSKAQALGWVFVSEGSKLGAGVLIKQARLLGLSETHGARHMGEPAEGRGRNWKSFIEMLDAVELTPEEDTELEQAANDAFSRFTFLLEQTYVKQPELA